MFLKKHSDFDILTARRYGETVVIGLACACQTSLSLDDVVVDGGIPREVDDIIKLNKNIHLKLVIISDSFIKQLRNSEVVCAGVHNKYLLLDIYFFDKNILFISLCFSAEVDDGISIEDVGG